MHLVIFFVTMAVRVRPANQMCQPPSDFETTCKTAPLNGVVSGGRCFFLINQQMPWADSFAACAKLNASLAQIHSALEFEKIQQHFSALPKPMNNKYGWIAMKVDGNKVKRPKEDGFLDPVHTFWHTAGPDMYDGRLNAGSTWINTHGQDDKWTFDKALCLHLYNSYTKVGDQQCGSKHYPICHRLNPSQRYKYYPNECMSEKIIETSEDCEPRSCGRICDQRVWCRSFNYKRNEERCELFSWSVSDAAKNANVTGCYHYSVEV